MVYKWYILPIGGLYGTYRLLREPGNSIDNGNFSRLGGYFVLNLPNWHPGCGNTSGSKPYSTQLNITTQHKPTKLSHEKKNLITFHYTGWLLGIFIVVYEIIPIYLGSVSSPI